MTFCRERDAWVDKQLKIITGVFTKKFYFSEIPTPHQK